MRKYMYTILLCISCLAALPFITKKVFAPYLERKENLVENEPVNTEKPEDIKIPETPENSEESEDKENPEKTENGVDSKIEESPENDEVLESEDKELEFTKVEREYFKDALFIGDSRTVGLSEYADLNGAHVFADSGMNVYKLKDQKIKVEGIGKTTLDGLLQKQQYGKIYVMLGINELGYDYKQTVKRFGELIETIRQKQPQAIIFIGANLHVTGSKSAKSDIYNNKNINRFNKAIAKFADNKDIFYIDVNEIFDDKKGNLNKEYTADESHVLGKYYSEWADWILEKGVVSKR